MLNNKLKLIAKVDPSKHLMTQPVLHNRISQWTILLSKFNLEL